jgi:hypothetical protein
VPVKELFDPYKNGLAKAVNAVSQYRPQEAIATALYNFMQDCVSVSLDQL